MGPASCPQIKEQYYGLKRAATAMGYKSVAGMADFTLTVKTDPLDW